MKTKILAWVAVLALITAGTLTYAASTNTGSTVLNRAFTKMHFTGSGGFNQGWRGMMKGFDRDNMEGRGFMGNWLQANLTDAEKTKLSTMNDAEKKIFFEAKRTEQKALRDARESVMDKLINGEVLSDAEKATLATIKTERAEKKAERLEREASLAEVQPIMEKVRAGTTLTADEQSKLDAFRTTMPHGGQKGMNGGEKWGMMRGMGR